MSREQITQSHGVMVVVSMVWSLDPKWREVIRDIKQESTRSDFYL